MDSPRGEPGDDRVADGRGAHRGDRAALLRRAGATAAAAEVLASSAAAGVLRPILSGGVSIVNARAAARERGIEIVESRSTRTAALHEPRVAQAAHERRRAVGRGHGLRAEQPAAGVGRRRQRRSAALGRHAAHHRNDDQPGVIGEVGTILGRHKVNIANFALGRNETGAVGVVNVDEETSAPDALDAAVEAIRRVPAIRAVWIVRLGV